MSGTVIVVTDRTICKRSLPHQLKIVAKTSPDMIILREKDLSEQEYEELAIAVKAVCDDSGMTFVINSFINVALKLSIMNVQLPFNVFKENLTIVDSFKSVGVSVHNLKEASDAEKSGADYLIFGNIFETSCKPGVSAKGLESLQTICSSVKIPVYGIGGIDEMNADSVLKAGASGVCIRSAFMLMN